MNIMKNIRIELSESDVKKIIADYLNREGYAVTSDDVSISVDSRIEGYGVEEHEVSYFKAAYVNCNIGDKLIEAVAQFLSDME